jgi:hypothetical protein
VNKPSFVHILNGDSLFQQFPKDIPGDFIICRECLCDGPVNATFPNDFYTQRSTFIFSLVGNFEPIDYYKLSVSEFDKIRSIPNSTEIYCWFEDDLFCQVNFWFTVWLLHQQKRKNAISLIRPKILTQFGFGGLSSNELKEIVEHKILITDLESIATLWELYKSNHLEDLLNQAQHLPSEFSFVQNAVQAHIDRFPSDKNNQARPEKILLEIAAELNTTNFNSLFK